MQGLAGSTAPSVPQARHPQRVCSIGESSASVNHATGLVSRARDVTGDAVTPTANRRPTRARKRLQHDLSLLPDMPIDILNEILRYLAPEDLLKIAREDSRLRDYLNGPHAKVIWMDVRKEWADAPQPPSGLSELRWASLLFERSCSVCKKNNHIVAICWPLLKRACKACTRANLLTHSMATKTNPAISYEIFDYLPSVQTTWGSKKVSARELHVAHEEWTTMKSYITNGTPGARKALRLWKKSKRDYIAQLIEMKEVVGRWEVRMAIKQATIQIEMRKARLESAKEWLLKLGYETIDIQNAVREDSLGDRPKGWSITPASWAKIGPGLQKAVEEVRDQRRAFELHPVVEQRIKILNDLYTEYLSRARPQDITTLACPPPYFLWSTPNVLALLLADKDTQPAEVLQRASMILEEMPTIIENHRREKYRQVLTQLPVDELPYRELSIDMMTLARFVFQCDHCLSTQGRSSALVGWDVISGHYCLVQNSVAIGPPGVWVNGFCKININATASWFASNLISMAGLDYYTTTIQEMDDLDARFVCLHNAYNAFATPGSEYSIHTWRSMLEQFTIQYRNSVLWPFRLADAEETAMARKDTAQLRISAEIWACNHCLKFNADTRGAAFPVLRDHLESVHNIRYPAEKKDYLFIEQYRCKLDVPYIAHSKRKPTV